MLRVRHTTSLLPDLRSAAIARAFVAEHGGHLSASCVADAQVCVSELVSNAVLHGRPDITLEVSTEPPGIGINVAVTDLGPDLGPDLLVAGVDRPDPTNPHGRGLLIVATLAEAWGIDRNGATGSTESGDETDEGHLHPGKTVWFELH